jgi:hypothetical protein
MWSKIIALLLAVLWISNVSFAQTRSVTRLVETGLWNGLYLKTRFSDKLGYYAEHHWRLRNSPDNLYDFIGQKRQFYNRFGVNFFFSDRFEAVIGPTLVLNFTPDPGNPEYDKIAWEPRIWHQYLLMMPPMGRIKIFHQFRFEHRWKRSSNRVNTPHDYTDRYRYKFFAYIPINKDKIEVKTLFISPSAEIFMHSGKSIVYHPFEDFRTYNGVGYVVNRNLTFFAGHMWTLGQNPSGFEYSTSHIFRINAFIGLDLRRIEKTLPPINIGF